MFQNVCFVNFRGHFVSNFNPKRCGRGRGHTSAAYKINCHFSGKDPNVFNVLDISKNDLGKSLVNYFSAIFVLDRFLRIFEKSIFFQNFDNKIFNFISNVNIWCQRNSFEVLHARLAQKLTNAKFLSMIFLSLPSVRPQYCILQKTFHISRWGQNLSTFALSSWNNLIQSFEFWLFLVQRRSRGNTLHRNKWKMLHNCLLINYSKEQYDAYHASHVCFTTFLCMDVISAKQVCLLFWYRITIVAFMDF